MAASFFVLTPSMKLFIIFEEKEDETLADIITDSINNSL